MTIEVPPGRVGDDTHGRVDTLKRFLEDALDALERDDTYLVEGEAEAERDHTLGEDESGKYWETADKHTGRVVVEFETPLENAGERNYVSEGN